MKGSQLIGGRVDRQGPFQEMLLGLVPPPLGIRGRLKLTTDFPRALHSHLRDVLHRRGTHKDRRPDKGEHEGGELTAISAG
jgi:hypothetical protein